MAGIRVTKFNYVSSAILPRSRAKHENKQNSDRGKQLKRKQRKHFPPSQQRQSTSQQPIMEQLGTHSVYTMFYLFIVERSGKSEACNGESAIYSLYFTVAAAGRGTWPATRGSQSANQG